MIGHQFRNDHISQTSDGLYDRHHYKVIAKDGTSVVVDNWAQAHEIQEQVTIS